MQSTALLLTWSGDHYTPDRVADGLRRRGVRPLRVDTDQFPTALQLRWSLGPDGPAPAGDGPLEGLDPDDVVAIWWRRFWTPSLPIGLDPEQAAACTRESITTSRAFFLSYGRARHVNDPSREAAAEDKLRQLASAHAAGLRCPDTLVTNDPAAVRALYDRHDGRLITKMLTPYSRTMAGDGDFVYTSRVGPDDLEALDGLSLCPMVFQEELPRAREHRLIWVGGRSLAGALDTGAIDQTDWRRQNELAWARSAPPAPVAESITRLMGQLGLIYGAFDFIETPDGEWVFLEVNPAGEWGMLERDLGLPIGDAIAEAMLGEAA